MDASQSTSIQSRQKVKAHAKIAGSFSERSSTAQPLPSPRGLFSSEPRSGAGAAAGASGDDLSSLSSSPPDSLARVQRDVGMRRMRAKTEEISAECDLEASLFVMNIFVHMDTDNSGNIDFNEFERAVVSNTKLSQLLLVSPLFDSDEVVMTSARQWTPPPGGGGGGSSSAPMLLYPGSPQTPLRGSAGPGGDEPPPSILSPSGARRPAHGHGTGARLFGVVDIRTARGSGVFGRSHNEFVCACSAVQPVALRTMRFSHAHRFHCELNAALAQAGSETTSNALLTMPPKLMNWGALASSSPELNQRKAGLERFFAAALSNSKTRPLTLQFLAGRPDLRPDNHGAALGMLAK